MQIKVNQVALLRYPLFPGKNGHVLIYVVSSGSSLQLRTICDGVVGCPVLEDLSSFGVSYLFVVLIAFCHIPSCYINSCANVTEGQQNNITQC